MPIDRLWAFLLKHNYRKSPMTTTDTDDHTFECILPQGFLYIEDGKVGEKYVIDDQVITLNEINDGSVNVSYHGFVGGDRISRRTVVEPFSPSKHKKLLSIKREKQKDE